MNTTAIIVPLTTHSGSLERKRIEKSEYLLYGKNYSFLPKGDSAVMCNQVRTVSRVRFGKYLGKITEDDLERVKIRIMFVFGITSRSPETKKV